MTGARTHRLFGHLLFWPALAVWTWKLVEPNPVPEVVGDWLDAPGQFLIAKSLHFSGYAYLAITLGIWEKHGIRQAGFWTVLVGESNQTLHYLVQWASLAERETKWNAFMADPEWIAKRTETEHDGPIVAKITSSFLQPTSFSSVK